MTKFYALDSFAACGYIPKIILFHTGSGVDRIGMYTDMFCRVVAEAADAHVDEVIDKLHIVFLECGVFGVDIRQTAGALQGCTGNGRCSRGWGSARRMIHFVATADCGVELGRTRSMSNAV